MAALNEQIEINFLGNLYGFHDGYDGSVFDEMGVSPSIRAGYSHIPHIAVKEDTITEWRMLVPNNFQHQAGDGTATRKHHLADIVPALQANCGATQCSYVLEIYDGN